MRELIHTLHIASVSLLPAQLLYPFSISIAALLCRLLVACPISNISSQFITLVFDSHTYAPHSPNHCLFAFLFLALGSLVLLISFLGHSQKKRSQQTSHGATPGCVTTSSRTADPLFTPHHYGHYMDDNEYPLHLIHSLYTDRDHHQQLVGASEGNHIIQQDRNENNGKDDDPGEFSDASDSHHLLGFADPVPAHSSSSGEDVHSGSPMGCDDRSYDYVSEVKDHKKFAGGEGQGKSEVNHSIGLVGLHIPSQELEGAEGKDSAESLSGKQAEDRHTCCRLIDHGKEEEKVPWWSPPPPSAPPAIAAIVASQQQPQSMIDAAPDGDESSCPYCGCEVLSRSRVSAINNLLPPPSPARPPKPLASPRSPLHAPAPAQYRSAAESTAYAQQIIIRRSRSDQPIRCKAADSEEVVEDVKAELRPQQKAGDQISSTVRSRKGGGRGSSSRRGRALKRSNSCPVLPVAGSRRGNGIPGQYSWQASIRMSVHGSSSRVSNNYSFNGSSSSRSCIGNSFGSRRMKGGGDYKPRAAALMELFGSSNVMRSGRPSDCSRATAMSPATSSSTNWLYSSEALDSMSHNEANRVFSEYIRKSKFAFRNNHGS